MYREPSDYKVGEKFIFHSDIADYAPPPRGNDYNDHPVEVYLPEDRSAPYTSMYVMVRFIDGFKPKGVDHSWGSSQYWFFAEPKELHNTYHPPGYEEYMSKIVDDPKISQLQTVLDGLDEQIERTRSEYSEAVLEYIARWEDEEK